MLITSNVNLKAMQCVMITTFVHKTQLSKKLIIQKLESIFKNWCYVRTNHLLHTQEAPLYLMASQFC